MKILSAAVPLIPGAMLTCYGILLAQPGIPAKGLLFAAAFDVMQYKDIFDMCCRKGFYLPMSGNLRRIARKMRENSLRMHIS